MRQYWFRRTTWSSDIEAEFFARLKRAQDYNRPQYMRIQAITLLDADSNLWPDAEKLLNYALDTWPNDSDLVYVLDAKGRCRELAEDIGGAVDLYCAAIDQMRIRPSRESSAQLEAARLIAVNKIRDKYERALDEVSSVFASRSLRFPIDIFLGEGSRALIYHELGRIDEAKTALALAMAAERQSTSGLPQHPHLGRVSARYTELRRMLLEIARWQLH